MSRPADPRRLPVGAALLVCTLLAGCSMGPDSPVVAPQGPTAASTAVPEPTQELEAALYDDAVQQIETMLDAPDRTPVDEVVGSLRGSDRMLQAQILSIEQSDYSLVLHIQLLPQDGLPLDLSDVDGGLSGELGEGNRTIADFAVVDEASDRQILPTVYRPDVSTEDAAQRCMCSSLPAVLPPEGVRLTAHYVRPENGFRSVRVQIPGLKVSRPISPG